MLVLRESFADFLVGCGLGAKTVGIYVKKVDSAVLWLAERGVGLDEVSAADLAAWGNQLAPSTSNKRQARSAITYYMQWLGRETRVAKAIRVPPKPRYFCQAVTPYEARNLHKIAFEEGYPRGTAVLAGLYLALRVHEIAGMRWDWFDAALTRYTVTGKGTYTATLPVHHELAQHLAPLPTRYRYVFPGNRGRERVSEATVWLWIKAVGELAGIDNLRPHQLRHTAGATMNDTTGDLRATSEFLRHRRIETTMAYTRTADDKLRRAVESLDY